MQKIKVITSTNKTFFEQEVNKFMDTKEIVILEQTIHTTQTRKEIEHTIYFFYMDTKEYIQLQQMRNANNMPKSKPRPKKITKTQPKKQLETALNN